VARGDGAATQRFARAGATVLVAGVIRASDLLNRSAETFIAADLGVMTLLVLIDVVGRNTVGSLVLSEELGVRFLGTWFVFVGASVALKRGQLVALQFVVDRLPQAAQRSLVMVSDLLIIVFVLVVLVNGIDLVTFTFYQPSPIMQIPMGFAYLSVPVGAALMLLHCLAAMAQGKRVDGVRSVT
jgi:TRAP-type C4-dicarboxylate transport system permease small subunit